MMTNREKAELTYKVLQERKIAKEKKKQKDYYQAYAFMIETCKKKSGHRKIKERVVRGQI